MILITDILLIMKKVMVTMPIVITYNISNIMKICVVQIPRLMQIGIVNFTGKCKSVCSVTLMDVNPYILAVVQLMIKKG